MYTMAGRHTRVKIDKRELVFSWQIEANVGSGEKTKCGVKAPISTWLGILAKAGMQKFEIMLPQLRHHAAAVCPVSKTVITPLF